MSLLRKGAHKFACERSLLLGAVLGVSIVLNLVMAGFFRTTIPLVLDRVGTDPATSATIFITTAGDVLGFFPSSWGWPRQYSGSESGGESTAPLACRSDGPPELNSPPGGPGGERIGSRGACSCRVVPFPASLTMRDWWKNVLSASLPVSYAQLGKPGPGSRKRERNGRGPSRSPPGPRVRFNIIILRIGTRRSFTLSKWKTGSRCCWRTRLGCEPDDSTDSRTDADHRGRRPPGDTAGRRSGTDRRPPTAVRGPRTPSRRTGDSRPGRRVAARAPRSRRPRTRSPYSRGSTARYIVCPSSA